MGDRYVDLSELITEFIDEVLGAHGAYALSDVGQLDHPADAAAFIRLRVRFCDELIREGWQPSDEAARQLERDRVLLTEADEDDHLGRFTAEPTNARVAPAPRRGQATMEDQLEQMQHAMASRAVIEQAKGIAMERYGLRAEVAWSWLVRTSQNRNVKLRVIAEELVESVASDSSPLST
jgi:hypothetical protein